MYTYIIHTSVATNLNMYVSYSFSYTFVICGYWKSTLTFQPAIRRLIDRDFVHQDRHNCMVFLVHQFSYDHNLCLADDTFAAHSIHQILHFCGV